MSEKIVISPYLLSWQKRAFDIVVGCVFLFFSLPIMGILCTLILMSTGWPILFIQDRVGKNGKIFKMYKLRTMRVGADKEQIKYKKLNEANGPVFKIRNDPRFVGFGRWLSRLGLDELPQLFNVLRGEMSIIGPRPLPPNEYYKMPSEYLAWRKMIKPGIMSAWVYQGAHSLMLEQWIELDRHYFCKSSIYCDIAILSKVVFFIIHSVNKMLIL